ncbi:MAG: hypothetical protein OEW16_05955 [Gammaproteobacteria bacterium]|nr:hypothetical protein [Gammaproteobacteria bacterium]
MIDSLAERAASYVASIQKRGLPLIAVAVCFGLMHVGCSDSSDDSLGPWREEIRLSDGRVIVVERVESFDVKTPIGDPGSAFVKEARLKIVSPKELVWMPELVMSYRPVIFDYDPVNNLWFAIGVNDHACGGAAFRDGHMNARGTINLHPNFEFRLVDDAWRSVEVGPERMGLPANLLIQRTTVDQFDVVPLGEKARVDFDNRVPKQFRRIEPHIGCG